MTHGSATGTNKRSWTDRPEESKNKLGALVFFGVSASVLLGILLWILWPTQPMTTFAATISITEYGDGLPSPQFGIWNIEKMRTMMQNNGLLPWASLDKSSRSTNLENRKDIEARVTEWTDELKKHNLNERDTVFVQLRCHAAVIRKDKDKPWHCCLYIGESASDSSTYPVSEFMERLLSTIHADNIVLVADICDLKSSPQLGLFVNPVATYIKKACEDLKLDTKHPDRKLWVICSADDYQTAYYSELRQKTLIQEACEDALRRNIEKKELSLARYFESIYRHCHTATNGKQTPRLFLANTHDDCLPNNSNGWKLAEKVMVAQYSRKAPKNDGKEKLEDKKVPGKDPINPASQPPKSATRSMRNLIRPVSMLQRDETGSKGGTPEPSSSKPAVLDVDPALRLWQLRDQIAKRGESGEYWSPADFAPFVWRKMQYEVLRESSAKNKEQLDSDCEALFGLQNAISSTNSVESGNGKSSGWDLCLAWNNFLKSDTGYRLPWQEATNGLGDSNDLTDLERSKWRVTRSEYRSYIDSISNLTFWNDLIAEYPELQSEYVNLIDCLKTARTKIPKESTESAAEKSLDMQLEKARKAREAMGKFLAKKVSELATLKNTQLSWLDEVDYEVLLASPLLSYEQRKELRSAFANKEEKKVTAKDLPNFDSMYTSARIGFSNNSNSKDELGRYCQRLKDIAALCSNAELPAPPDLLEDFLAWGEKYVKTMRNDVNNSIEINDITQRWHYLSLMEISLDPTPVGAERSLESRSNWGIVVPPINPKAIRLVLPAGSQFDFLDGRTAATLRIGIRHFDNSAVDECNVQWWAPPSLKVDRLSVSGKQLIRDQITSVRPQSQQIELQCNLPATESLLVGSQISIIALDSNNSNNNNNSQPLVIPLIRNSGRIDLIARRVDDNSMLTVKNGNEIEFSSPAIKDAKSRFSFWLVNKLPTPRRVEIKVYAWPSVELPSPRDLSVKNLFAISEIRPLPGGRETKIPLMPFEQNAAVKFLENETATESSLVFQIIEYELEETDKAVSGGKIKDNKMLFLGRFKPTRPGVDKYLVIRPKQVRENFELAIEFESNQKLWDSYALKALPITIHSKWTLDSKQWSPKDVKSLPLQPDRKTDLYRGPGMDGKKYFRLSADIGGFPRAVVFDAKPSASAMELVYEDQVSITGIRPIVKERTDVKLSIDKKGRFVFPNRIGNIQVFYDGIEVDAVLDMGVNSNAVMDFSNRETPGTAEIPSIDIKFDRWYQTLLSTEPDGLLGIAFEAAELHFRPKIKTDDLNGVYVVGIRTGGQFATTEVVFDKIPLRPSRLECSGWPLGRRIDLFKGEKIELSIQAMDSLAGSGVKSAVFAVSNSAAPASFSDTDTALNKPEDLALLSVDDNRVKFILDSKEFEKKPAGEVWVVARTLDWAGNQQDNNKPVRIFWTGKEKPLAPK